MSKTLNIPFDLKKRIIILSCRGKTEKEISKLIQKDTKYVGTVIRAYRKERHSSYVITKRQESMIIKMYQYTNIKPSKISNYLGIKNHSIYQVLKRNNIPMKKAGTYERQYNLNEDYFEKIDNGNKAYWLGFLVGDGCVTKKHEIRIVLNSKDEQHLKRFLKDLGSNATTRKSYSKTRNASLAQVCSYKISKDLIAYGVVPNKTMNTILPIIPDHLKRHFIRGLFDSDGSLSIPSDFGKGRSPQFSITGTERLLLSVQEYMMNELNLKKTILKNRKNSKILRYDGRKQCVKILKWLYDDADVYLQRKYDRYIFIRDFYKNK